MYFIKIRRIRCPKKFWLIYQQLLPSPFENETDKWKIRILI